MSHVKEPKRDYLCFARAMKRARSQAAGGLDQLTGVEASLSSREYNCQRSDLLPVADWAACGRRASAVFAKRIGGRSTSLPITFVGDGHAAQIWAAGRVASDLPKTLDAGGASADCGGDGGGAELVRGLRDHQLPSSTVSERSVVGPRGGLLHGSVPQQSNRCEHGRFLLQLCAQGGDAPGPQAEPRHAGCCRSGGRASARLSRLREEVTGDYSEAVEPCQQPERDCARLAGHHRPGLLRRNASGRV